MRIEVNGELREIPDGSTVATLLCALEVPEGRVAVERNRRVVDRSRYAVETLSDGDHLEVVRFVGGG
jgi:sulfur carrier protein